jgi:hypothetical protein
VTVCLIWKSKQTTQASIILFKISKNLTESSSGVNKKVLSDLLRSFLL